MKSIGNDRMRVALRYHKIDLSSPKTAYYLSKTRAVTRSTRRVAAHTLITGSQNSENSERLVPQDSGYKDCLDELLEFLKQRVRVRHRDMAEAHSAVEPRVLQSTATIYLTMLQYYIRRC